GLVNFSSQNSWANCILYLISCFRTRIKSSVPVHQVLDLMPSLGLDLKRHLRAVAGEKGDVEAAEKLLSLVEKEAPDSPGLCQEFCQALVKGGYAAAGYLDPNLNELPSPSLEAAGDLGKALVNLFFDRLTDTLQATQVAFRCLGKGLLNPEDVERVSRNRAMAADKQGNKPAVREMLYRITQKKEWLSPFLEVLGEAGHANMAAYISGHPSASNRCDQWGKLDFLNDHMILFNDSIIH
uniref:Caspase recruitment domain-containing protein n=1 Tax=Laticauda laticaudata TaxID=8630 RepID=A0A8C5SKR7_LATLA